MPTVNAGPDQSITLPALATLTGSATDDGLPSGSSLSFAWTKVSGAGNVVFANAGAVTTTASFSAAGSYTIGLTVSDGQLSASDSITVSVGAAPVVASNIEAESGILVAPIEVVSDVQASGGQYIQSATNEQGTAVYSFAITESGVYKIVARVFVLDTASDSVNFQVDNLVEGIWDLNPSAAASEFNNWREDDVTSRGTGTFDRPQYDPYVVWLGAGTHTLRFRGREAFARLDYFRAERMPTIANQSPSVNAGSDQAVTLPASVSLAGVANDDGLPNGQLVSTWSKVSGPGTVTFASSGALATTASFSASGSYVLQLTTSDSLQSATDAVAITVNPALPNQPPTVSAGADQTVTLPSSVTLVGTARDDGLPNGQMLTTWSKVSGPGTVNFGSAGSLGTTVSFSAAGSYVLQLTATDTTLSSSDAVAITVNPAPAITVNAGSDQTITLPSSASLAGSTGGASGPLTTNWSKVSGLGNVTFGNSSALSTTAAFSAAGTYVLQLTASDGVSSTADSLTVGVQSATTTGKSFYVTQSGSGSRTGLDPGNAWSVADFNSSSSPTGGDVVNFSGTISSTVTPRTGGTGNGSSRLTLNFSGATLITASPRININQKNYLNIFGGVFGTATAGTMIGSGDAVAHDITISGWSHSGDSMSTANFVHGPQLSNVIVENNTLDNAAQLYVAYRATSHDIVIRNNYLRSSLNTTVQTDLIFLGDGVNVIIEGNKLILRAPGDAYIRHNDVIQTFRGGGEGTANPTNWTIRYNWIELDINGGDASNSWLMMEGMVGNPALEIYGNVFHGAGNLSTNGVCVVLNQPDAVFYFYNNTVIKKVIPGGTIRFLSPGTLYARNNVGQADRFTEDTFIQWTMTPGAAWDRNFFFNTDKCDRSISGPGGSCSLDPKFVDFWNRNYALQLNSPLIGAGDSTIGSEYNLGIAPGAVWPGPALVPRTANDVGAFVSPR